MKKLFLLAILVLGTGLAKAQTYESRTISGTTYTWNNPVVSTTTTSWTAIGDYVGQLDLYFQAAVVTPTIEVAGETFEISILTAELATLHTTISTRYNVQNLADYVNNVLYTPTNGGNYLIVENAEGATWRLYCIVEMHDGTRYQFSQEGGGSIESNIAFFQSNDWCN